MSKWLQTGKVILLILLCGFWAKVVSSGNSKVTAFASDSTEFVRGESMRAQAPDGKAAVMLNDAVNEDVNPTMEAQAGTKKLPLGELRSSAHVFWRPDSRSAVLLDEAYSNHYFVRLIRVRPALTEVPKFDEMIKKEVWKVYRSMHSGRIFHYWPHIMGWTREKQLFVVVFSDAVASKHTHETKVVGFCRGFLIDTDKVEIRRQLNESGVMKIVGTKPNPCE